MDQYNTALVNLYNTFASYHATVPMQGCPCCVSNTQVSLLHTKPLNKLTDDDIANYTFKAMTTWGDVNDFKNYLPRIFELLATRELTVDTFVVFNKLDYAKWQDWNLDERQAILDFLKAWWQYTINTSEFFDEELLIEINRKLQDLPTLLNLWVVSVKSQGFRNYVELVESYYYQLKTKNITFKNFSKEELDILKNWIDEHKNILEQGFFEYINTDEVLSKRISDALFIIETMK